MRPTSAAQVVKNNDSDDDDHPSPNTFKRMSMFEQIGVNAEGVDDDIERVQAHVFRRRIRVKPIFQVFDTLHTGRCSKVAFARALASVFAPNALNDAETPVDAEGLAEFFIDKRFPADDPRPVNYLKFCEVVDSVFTTQGLETNPEKPVPVPGATVLDANGFNPRAVRDESEIVRVLEKIAQLTEQRGIELHTCFNARTRAPVDIRAGRMEPQCFIANFPLAMTTPTKPAALTKADMQLLVQRYSDDNGFVRLVPFERDVQDLVAERKAATMQGGVQALVAEQNWVDAEPEGHKGSTIRSTPWFPLQASEQKRRPQSARVFRGTHFKESQSTQGSLQPRQVPNLTFATPPWLQNEETAQDAEESVPMASQSQRLQSARPQTARPQSSRPQSAQASSVGMQSSRPQSARPQSARSNAAQASSVGISLGATFAPCPFARMATGHPFAPGRPPRPHSARYNEGAPRQRPPPPSAMAKLIKACLERRLRLHDILKQFDEMREGVISRTQMCTAFSVLGIRFLPQELDALFTSFASNDGRFRYNACAEAVEEAIAKTKTVSLGGTGAAAARAIKQAGAIQTSMVIDDDEAELLDKVEEAIADRLLSQRLDLFPILEDMSRTRWAMPGHVTDGQFTRAMKNLNFEEVTPWAISTLLEKYCDTDLGNEFNHIDFLKNIEKRQAKKTFILSRFNLADTPKAAIGLHVAETSKNGPEWGNPYFDKLGEVRACGSRPGSAACSRPQSGRRSPFAAPRPTSACSTSRGKQAQYGQNAVPAGWRPGAGMNGNGSSNWFG